LTEQPSNTTGSSQVVSSGSSATHLHRVGFFAAQLQQGAQHAGIRAVALLQGVENGVEDVRHFAQKGSWLLSVVCVETNSSTTGK
jgi:hypothetical protein